MLLFVQLMSKEHGHGTANERKHTVDRELVSQEPHELEYLAHTHGASVGEVKAVVSEVGSRSRKRVEEAGCGAITATR